MVSTRASTSPKSQSDKTSPKNGAGTKRKAEPDSSPATKRGRGRPKKEQKTLEETMPAADSPNDLEMQEAEAEAETTAEGDGSVKPADDSKVTAPEDAKEDTEAGAEKEEEAKEEAEIASKPANGENGAIETSAEKENKLPSNIVEKGIVYFITRGRVGVEDPESVQDLQRTYLVLRPLPADAKLGDGAIQDLKNNRLIAIPKKVLPKSHQDRFMVFVEKSKTTMEDLKENFFQGSEYETATVGTRQTHPITPIGEGVYAITSQGANTHLAYMLTIPSDLGEIQNDMGIRTKGTFLVSLKNPTRKGPANASLPEDPGFPQDILDEFRGRAWMPPSRADVFDYPNAQFLLIGEGEAGFDKATEGTSKDQKDNKETPAEEIEQLENEDEIRVEHLHGRHVHNYTLRSC